MTQLNRDIDAQAKVRNMRCSDKSLTDFAEHGAEEKQQGRKYRSSKL